MSKFEDKNNPGLENQEESLSENETIVGGSSDLHCLSVPLITVVDEDRTLVSLSKPISKSKSVPSLSHAELVSMLKPEIDTYARVVTKDLLENSDILDIKNTTKVFNEILEETDHCKKPSAITLAINRRYPIEFVDQLIGAPLSKLKDLSSKEVLEVLRFTIENDTTNIHLNEDRKEIANYIEAVSRLEERGIKVFISAGNKVEEDFVDGKYIQQINIYTLAGTSVAATNTKNEGEIAEFSYDNPLVDEKHLGVFHPTILSKEHGQEVDLTGNGKGDLTLKNFLEANDLEYLASLVGKKQNEIETKTLYQNDFRFFQDIYLHKIKELIVEPENENLSKLELMQTAYFGKTGEEGVEGSLDYEVKHHLLKQKEGVYDLQALRGFIGLPLALNSPMLAYNLGEGENLFYLEVDSKNNSLYITDDSLKNFQFITQEGTSFAVLGAALKSLKKQT